MKKFKTAFITFFPAVPDNMGSSAVVNSRFKSWPYEKKIFQLSHVNKLNNKNLKTIFILFLLMISSLSAEEIKENYTLKIIII